MFLIRSDLQVYCPNETQVNISKVILDVENLFCGLLPLSVEDRDISFYDDEVYLQKGWNKVNTSLLNINSAKFGETNLEIKVVGRNKSELFFKLETIEFDPVLTLTINSGYDDDTLPGDIRQAMIDYAKDQILLLGNPSDTTSVNMGPRKLTFSGEGSKNTIMQVLYKYLI